MTRCGRCGLAMEYSTDFRAWVHVAQGHTEVLTALDCPGYAAGAPAAPYEVLTPEQRRRILTNVRLPADAAFDSAWWTAKMGERRTFEP